MKYSIRELSELAGVSARTLRYYDEMGLLKPLYTSEAGYRYYGEREAALLWQILFYRQQGFELKQIQRILYQRDFDILAAMEEHLLELEGQRRYVDTLIETVKKTISSMKGECVMSDQEKFRVFKENSIKENEEKYGQEIREKYGEEEVEASKQKMLNMTREQWQHFQSLEEEILKRLESCVEKGITPESEEAGTVVRLHREWLSMTWKQYTPKAHRGVAALYTADERFRTYYDRKVPGCAEFLRQAVECWAEQL